MADIREQDLDLKTAISDTDWMRLVTPTGNHRMTVGQFKDLIGYTTLQQRTQGLEDEVNTHVAEYATLTPVSASRMRLRVPEGSVQAYRIGKLVIITFDYDPSLNAGGFAKYDSNIITVNEFRPKYKVAGAAYPASSADLVHKVVPYITPAGAIGVVNSLNNYTDSGLWNCTLVYFTD